MNKCRRKALELLSSSHFFSALLTAKRRTGLVGEERNALVVYIVATSRLLAKPLCLFVKGPSSVGKNFLTDSILGLFPESEVQSLTSSSDRSWNYFGNKLKNKVVYIKEKNKQSGSVHPARLLISEKQLTHSVTVKRNERFVREQRVTKGPVAAISTTTSDRVEVDDETRHISIWADETPEQTSRIIEGCLDQTISLTTTERRTWHEVQRLLQERARYPIEFRSWFKAIGGHVPTDNLWIRRYFPAFLQACRTVALIRSFRFDEKKIKSTRTIEPRFSDLAITTLIFNPVFAQSLDRADDHDLEIRRHVRNISRHKNGEAVRASELAEELGVTGDQAYGFLRKAAAAGTIFRSNSSNKGNLKLYLPSRNRPFLPEPDELFRKLNGVSGRVKFVHPLTDEWVTYGLKTHS